MVLGVLGHTQLLGVFLFSQEIQVVSLVVVGHSQGAGHMLKQRLWEEPARLHEELPLILRLNPVHM